MFTTLQECLIYQGIHSDTGIYFVESEKDTYVSYRELYKSAEKAAKLMRKHGVSPGEYIILQLNTPREFLVAFWGGILGGFIPVPVPVSNTKESALRIKQIQSYFERCYVVTNQSISTLVRQQFDLNEMCKEIVMNIEEDVDDGEGFSPPSVKPDDVAFIQFSSGSTGSPKGVMNTHKNIIANCYSMAVSGNVTKSDRFGSWLPLTHNMGLVTFHILPLIKGVSQFIMSTEVFLRTPYRWMESAGKYKTTVTGSPNFGLRMCNEMVKYEPDGDLELSAIRVIICGAEPISANECRLFTDFYGKYGLRKNAIVPAYGLTEAGLGVSMCLLGDDLNVLYLNRNNLGICDKIEISNEESGFEVVSVGRPLYQNKLRIIGENGSVLPEDYIGLIQIQGDNVTKGYYKNEEADKEAFADDGWFNTGDIGFFHDGNLYITGRFKEMILINGLNYYLYDIERVIQSKCINGIQKSIAIGIYNYELKKEELMIFVKLNEKADFDSVAVNIVNEIRRCIGIQVAGIVKIDNFPVTTSGKVQRFVIKKLFEAKEKFYSDIYYTDRNETVNESKQSKGKVNTIQSAEIQMTDKKIQDYLKSEIALTLKVSEDEVDIDTPFSEMGISSIDIEKLFYNVEQNLNISFDISQIWNYPTIRLLSQHLSRISPDILDDVEQNLVRKNSCEGIAIIGMACRFPGGANNPQQFFNNLLNQKDCIISVPKERTKLFGANTNGRFKGGYIENIDKFDTRLFSISPQEAAKMDPQQRILLLTAYDAFQSSEIPMENILGSNCGVFVGIGSNDYSRILQSAGIKTDIYASTGNSLSIASNRLSYCFNLNGPSITIDTACSSSLTAVHEACLSLNNGDCDMAVVAGVNIILSDDVSEAFQQAGMLSPDSKCKTFDAMADGYVRGEGCGVVLLKPLSKAIEDNNNIYAIIKGTAVNQDGRSNGLTAPNGLAQQEVILKAITRAGIEPCEVNYIETHGTGTKLGDPIEVNSLSTIYSKGRKIDNPCFLGAVKTNIGHLEAAAGIASLIKTVIILQTNRIPPNLNYKKSNPYIKVNNSLIIPAEETLLRGRKKKVKYAAVSAFGFGGSNAHVILSAYDNPPEKIPSQNYPFELKSYWIQVSEEKTNQVTNILNEKRGVTINMNQTDKTSSIIELFMKQTELMEQMNRILCDRGEVAVALETESKAVNMPYIQGSMAKSDVVKTGSDYNTEMKNSISYDSVVAEIIHIIAELTAYDEKDIGLNSDIMNDLGFDSIMAGNMVVEIINAYPVLNGKRQEIIGSFQNESMTVQSIVDTVVRELSEFYDISNDVIQNSNDNGVGTISKSLEKSAYIFTESPEYLSFKKRKDLAGTANPYFKVNSGIPRDVINIGGKDYINFTTYNYVGLNGRQEVINAVKDAIEKYGTSVSGSRLLSGEIPLHEELENEITDFLGTEDTIVYVGGHGTNLNTIGHFVSKGDLILHDSLAHNSIIEGSILSGATRRSFIHNNMKDLENILEKVRNKFNKVLIVVEGIYSMDGDMCPLPELIYLKKKYKAYLMVDEAHSLGTVGDCGRGVGDYFKVSRSDVDFWMGTLSKSLASCGGYISGSKELIEYLKYTSPGFIFSCGITPSNTAAALAALRLLRTEPELISKLKENSELFLKLSKEAGFDTGNSKDTPIVPIMISDSDTAMKLTQKLFERGINVMPIVYPAVPEDMVRFRFFLSSLHTKEQIEYTIKVLSEEVEQIK